MTIKKVWLNICQFLVQDISSNAQKLRIGPGRTGRMQPTTPAMASINPMIRRTTFKWLACCRIVSTDQSAKSCNAQVRISQYHLANGLVKMPMVLRQSKPAVSRPFPERPYGGVFIMLVDTTFELSSIEFFIMEPLSSNA